MLTITKHNVIVLAVSAAIAASIPFVYPHPNSHCSYQTFQTGKGWGYDVFVNGKLLIHQESIPAISGQNGFPTQQQAQKTAQLILSRMKNNNLPTLSKKEVEQICGFSE